MIGETKHQRRVVFCVEALFLHGLSEKLVGQHIGRAGFPAMTKGAVSGILNRAKLRGLTDLQRQAKLDEMRADRLDIRDDGSLILAPHIFTIAPRDGRGGK